MNRILIIDLLSVLHTIKFSLGKNRLSENDKHTFIIYGFLFKLNFLLKKTKASQVVFALDSKHRETSKRKKLYPEYKEKRNQNQNEKQIELDNLATPQFQKIIEYVLPTIGYKNLFGSEGYEADDSIGVICKKYTKKQIVICTTDHDMYQLLTENVCILNAKSNQWYTITDFEKEFGIAPKMWKRVKAIGGCFDKKTEILTDRGWVKFPNIKKSDKVYSMNPDSRIAEYEKITNIISYKYTGEMYKIKGKLIDFLVTPNHKFFGSSTQFYPTEDSKYKVNFKEIQDIVKYKNFTIPITSNWTEGTKKDKFILPEIVTKWNTDCKLKGKYESTRRYSSVEIDMCVWLSFLGIYLADGHTSINRNGQIGSVGISAIKKRKLDFFKPILDSTPWKWRKIKTGWQIDNRQLAVYLHKLGTVKEKYIPREFLNLNTQQLQVLFDCLISGDGCVSVQKYNAFGNEGSTKRISYSSSSKKLINDVQEIAIKLGHASIIIEREAKRYNIKGKSGQSDINYQLNINKSKNANLLKKEITKIDFNDFVYDVTTEPHHTILVRRNGVVAWSSNCSSDNVKGVPIPQSDPNKKQMHVAEKGALNYIKGITKPTTKAFQAIKSREGKDIINRNKALVILPFKGTPDYTIGMDYLDLRNFIKVCIEYDFQAILEDIHPWKSTLKLR